MSKCHHVKLIVLWLGMWPYVLLLQCFWQRHAILTHFNLSVWCFMRSSGYCLEWACFISSFNGSKLTFVVFWEQLNVLHRNGNFPLGFLKSLKDISFSSLSDLKCSCWQLSMTPEGRSICSFKCQLELRI